MPSRDSSVCDDKCENEIVDDSRLSVDVIDNLNDLRDCVHAVGIVIYEIDENELVSRALKPIYRDLLFRYETLQTQLSEYRGLS